MNNDDFYDNGDSQHDAQVKDGSREPGVKHHRHRHSSSRYWIVPLWVAIALETLMIIGLLVWISRVEQENREHVLREEELSLQIKADKTELDKVREEFNKLKTDKLKAYLPNLIPLKLDQVMEINKEYVKSGIFMHVGKKDQKFFEYKLILENKSQSDIFPRVEILFFNNAGYQVGVSRIGYNKDGSPTREILEKGEIRSFAATFEISNDAQPEYFMVKLRND